jgi:hypothetical protein
LKFKVEEAEIRNTKTSKALWGGDFIPFLLETLE